MRLSKMGLRLSSTLIVSLAVFSAVANAAPQRGDFGSAAVESTMMSATTLVDARAERFASSLVPEFSEQKPAPVDRIHLAYAPTDLSPVRRRASEPAALVPQVAEPTPSFWLMGAVTVFLIGYQLRRKHRLLRPHRFHEL